MLIDQESLVGTANGIHQLSEHYGQTTVADTFSNGDEHTDSEFLNEINILVKKKVDSLEFWLQLLKPRWYPFLM